MCSGVTFAIAFINTITVPMMVFDRVANGIVEVLIVNAIASLVVRWFTTMLTAGILAGRGGRACGTL
jgi:hypothetical protein